MPNDLLEYTHGLPISVNDLVWETHNNNNYYYLELARNTYVIYGDNKQPIGVCNFDINTGKFNFKIDHSDYLNIDISIVDTEIAKTPDFSMAHIIGSFISIYREINNNESPRSYNTFFYIISKESSLSHIIVEAKTFNFDTKRLTTFMKTHAVIDYFNESTPHYVFYNTATHGKNKSNHKSFSKCDSHTTTYFWRNYYYVYSLDEHNNRYFKTLKDAIDSIATTCLKADDSLKIKQVTVANNFVTKVYHNKNIIHKLIRSYIRNDMPNITNCIVYFNKCDQYKTHYGQSSGQYTRDGHVNDYDEHLNDYAHFVAKYINVVQYDDKRLIGCTMCINNDTMLFINVYLSYQCDENYDDFVCYLGKLSAHIGMSTTASVVLAGDFNAQNNSTFETNSIQYRQMKGIGKTGNIKKQKFVKQYTQSEFDKEVKNKVQSIIDKTNTSIAM